MLNQLAIDFLDEEFEESVFNAENKSPGEQTKLIAKATALKRKSHSKKEEIKEKEKQIQVLEEKRKKM